MDVIVCFVLMIIFGVFIFTVIYYGNHLITKGVWAGTNSYMPSGTITDIEIPWVIRDVSNEYSTIAIAHDNGPLCPDGTSRYWEETEYLICKEDFGRCTEGRFYLVSDGKTYRIVQCLYAMNTYANTIFNTNVSKVIGEVVAVYHREYNKVDYSIGRNTNIVSDIEWDN